EGGFINVKWIYECRYERRTIIRAIVDRTIGNAEKPKECCCSIYSMVFLRMGWSSSILYRSNRLRYCDTWTQYLRSHMLFYWTCVIICHSWFLISFYWLHIIFSFSCLLVFGRCIIRIGFLF